MTVVAEECRDAALSDTAFVERWLEHRNDVSALEALISRGYVVDTMEVSAPWSRRTRCRQRSTPAAPPAER